VAVLSENLVLLHQLCSRSRVKQAYLGEEHSLDTTHEDTSLTVEVREDLFLKRGLVKVTGSDGDTEGDGLLLGLTGDILPDGDGRVDTSSLEEESSDSSSRSLGGDEDNVDVLGWDNVGLQVSKVQALT